MSAAVAVDEVWREHKNGTLPLDDAALHVRALVDVTDYGAREILTDPRLPSERWADQ